MTARTREPGLSIAMNWNLLIRTGGFAALAIVGLIPVQILIFTIFPPPESTLGFFELFHESAFLGLLSLDLLYFLNNALIVLLYLAFFAALRNANPAALLIALIIGFIGIAAYYASSVAFEMLSLSKQYFLAGSDTLRQQLLGAGHGLLLRYKGSAFDIYYVFNAVTLLIVSLVMLRDRTFTRTTAVWGLVSALFMAIPSTAGTLGLIFSLLSLIPWTVFSLLAAKKLLKMNAVS